jgi:uncharacterized protein YecE (DUF72 family)
MPAMGDVRIGTSGWSYPSGPGTWNGIFYPAARTVRGRRFDELAYYAEHFDTVEVNSSFYRLPDPETTRKWAERTPPSFDFAMKLFQKFTHPAMYQGSHRGASAIESETSAVPVVSLGDVDAFKAAIDPLASAGKLGALLAQFPPSFRDSAETRAYLAWLLEAFRGFPLAVELRHRSWSDHVTETLSLLNGLGAAWAQIDETKFRFSIRQNHLPNLRGLYYMRLHGRNAEKWWTHDHADERYNYLYSPAEISTMTDTIASVRRLVQTIYVFMNNHFAAKAVANAATMKHQLGETVPGEYPNEMLERYPFMREFATAAERKGAVGLFEEAEDRKEPAGGAESEEE